MQCMEFNPSWLKSLLRCPCTQKATAFPWTLGLRSFSIPPCIAPGRPSFKWTKSPSSISWLRAFPCPRCIMPFRLGRSPAAVLDQKSHEIDLKNAIRADSGQFEIIRTLVKRSLKSRFQNTFNPFSQRLYRLKVQRVKLSLFNSNHFSQPKCLSVFTEMIAICGISVCMWCDESDRIHACQITDRRSVCGATMWRSLAFQTEDLHEANWIKLIEFVVFVFVSNARFRISW